MRAVLPGATYTGWALRASAPGNPVPIVDGCDAAGQKISFQKTAAARLAAGDPRLSLQERYADHATYVNLVTQAALQQSCALPRTAFNVLLTGTPKALVPNAGGRALLFLCGFSAKPNNH